VPKFRRKWSLIVLMDEGCAETCQAVLYETRQVRKALSRERDRTQRVMLIAGDFDRATVELQHPDLIILTAESPAAQAVDAAFAELDRAYIYLADPLGNLMMRFPRDTTMKEIHTDLKKLLKLSRIG
ncbi:MAG: cytochrome C oxidase subunit I, partial [Gammaproteobacteria bacterium]|nr:cytochrome C oxidase subunit I [Gammaproteobacteria bacterium]